MWKIKTAVFELSLIPEVFFFLSWNYLFGEKKKKKQSVKRKRFFIIALKDFSDAVYSAFLCAVVLARLDCKRRRGEFRSWVPGWFCCWITPSCNADTDSWCQCKGITVSYTATLPLPQSEHVPGAVIDCPSACQHGTAFGACALWHSAVLDFSRETGSALQVSYKPGSKRDVFMRRVTFYGLSQGVFSEYQKFWLEFQSKIQPGACGSTHRRRPSKAGAFTWFSSALLFLQLFFEQYECGGLAFHYRRSN